MRHGAAAEGGADEPLVNELEALLLALREAARHHYPFVYARPSAGERQAESFEAVVAVARAIVNQAEGRVAELRG